MSKPAHKSRGAVAARQAPTQTSQQLTVEQRQITAHSGPIPDPETLAAYDKLLPGAAERILGMAERQQISRLENEQLQLKADIKHREDVLTVQKAATKGTLISDYIGQVLGFALAAACVAGAGYAGIVQRDPWIAAVFISLPAVGIIRAVRGMVDRSPPKK